MSRPLAHAVRDEVDETIEHFNANHADTVLLLARFGAGCVDALDAEAVAVDRSGVDIAVRLADGEQITRLAFDGEVATSAEVSAQVFAHIAGARAAAGDRMPITSMEAEMNQRGGLGTYPARVAAVRDLTPNLREIVVEGIFEGFESLGQDQFVYLFVGRDGPLPEDYSMAAFMAEEPERRPLGAYYTVRAWDADARRMTMWFVLHGHDGGVGGWAGRCRVGEELALWGPRASFTTPADARTHLFVADESGFAAVAARVDELPDGAEIIVIAETIDEAHVFEFVPPGHVDTRWVFRRDVPPGVGTGLIDAVRTLDLDRPGLVAFGAAESKQVSAIRRLLRREHGLAADHVSMTGYWRRTPH